MIQKCFNQLWVSNQNPNQMVSILADHLITEFHLKTEQHQPSEFPTHPEFKPLLYLVSGNVWLLDFYLSNTRILKSSDHGLKTKHYQTYTYHHAHFLLLRLLTYSVL